MNMSPQQANAALADAHQTVERSRILYGYQQRTPYFIVWGLVWFVAYSMSHFLPSKQGSIWLVLDMLGASASFWIARRNQRQHGHRDDWRWLAVGATLCAFIIFTFQILTPHSSKQIASYIPLLFGTIYVVVGIWYGPRLIVAGVAIMGLSLIGYFWIDTYFNLWMAVLGGGALVGTGLWLRRV